MSGVTVRAIDDMRSSDGHFYFAGLDLGVVGWGMNVLRMPPNWSGHRGHDHVEDGQEEVYVVLEGRAILEVGVDWITLRPGMFARVSPYAHRKLVTGDEGATVFYTEPGDLDVVAKALAERKWSVSSARLIWRAKNPVTVDDDAKRAEVEAFLEALDSDDDVQRLYVGLA